MPIWSTFIRLKNVTDTDIKEDKTMGKMKELFMQQQEYEDIDLDCPQEIAGSFFVQFEEDYDGNVNEEEFDSLEALIKFCKDKGIK